MHLNHKVLNIIKSAVHPTPEGVGFSRYIVKQSRVKNLEFIYLMAVVEKDPLQ